MTLLVITSTAIYADRRTLSALRDSRNCSTSRKIHQIREGYYFAADGTLIKPCDYLPLYNSFKQAIKDGTAMKLLPNQSSSGLAILTPDRVYVQTDSIPLKVVTSDMVVPIGSADITAEGLIMLGYSIPAVFRNISNHNPTVSRQFDVVSIPEKEDEACGV